MVSFGLEGDRDHPARNPCAMGIVPVSAGIGAGNPDPWEAGRKSAPTCAR
jgi:hypothetical protein